MIAAAKSTAPCARWGRRLAGITRRQVSRPAGLTPRGGGSIQDTSVSQLNTYHVWPVCRPGGAQGSKPRGRHSSDGIKAGRSFDPRAGGGVRAAWVSNLKIISSCQFAHGVYRPEEVHASETRRARASTNIRDRSLTTLRRRGVGDARELYFARYHDW